MVWGAVWGDRVIGPYFFEKTVSGKTFKDMLMDYAIPCMQQYPEYTNVQFLLDGCPAHWSVIVREVLNKEFSGDKGWIGRSGNTVQWCAYSPDLNVCDSFLWRYITNYVYKPQSYPETKNQLRQNY